MRGLEYDYDFSKPDKTVISFTKHTMKQMIENVIALTKEHYDLEYSFTRDTVYNIMARPQVAHQFYLSKLKIRKHIPQQPVHHNTNE